jgi:hypothetical protein
MPQRIAKEENVTDRRQQERMPLLLDVQWESLSGKHSARITDISRGGCYIESLGQVTVGETIRFKIQLPTGRSMSLGGKVMYHHPNLGFGVCFDDLTEQDHNALAQLLEVLAEV